MYTSFTAHTSRFLGAGATDSYSSNGGGLPKTKTTTAEITKTPLVILFAAATQERRGWSLAISV